MQGKFITLEGIEGSGKSTSLENITNILEENSINYVTTKEPGGGPLGDDLRSLLLNKDTDISYEVELLLMMADRKDHLDKLVTPNLNEGIWVVSDRYLDSTYAYQGGGRQIDTSIIDNLSKTLGLLKPDLTLLFDISPDIALERAQQRSSLDRFESEPMDFHNRIREAYIDMAKLESDRIRVIDSSLDFDSVKNQVTSIITKFIND